MSTSRDTMIKWSVYAAAILLLSVVYEFTAAHLRVWDVVPFLPPVLLAVVASHEDTYDATLFGVAFGACCDLTLAAPLPCLYTICFALAALLASVMAKSMLQPGFFCSLVVSAMAFVLVWLLLAVLFLLGGRAAFFDIARRGLAELLLSLPLVLVCHPVFSFLHRRFTL